MVLVKKISEEQQVQYISEYEYAIKTNKCFTPKMQNHLVPFGRNRLLEVPEFEGVVFRDGDQYRFHRMEGQGPHSIEVASQSIFGIPCLSECILIGWQLKTEEESR